MAAAAPAGDDEYAVYADLSDTALIDRDLAAAEAALAEAEAAFDGEDVEVLNATLQTTLADLREVLGVTGTAAAAAAGDGSDAVASHIAHLEKIVEKDGAEYEALCVLRAVGELVGGTAGTHHAALVTRLFAHAETRLARNAANLPLLQLTDAAWTCDTSDPLVKDTCDVWQVASHIYAEHGAAQELADPVGTFTANFVREFRYHFEGALPTADINHPEWVLSYTKKVMLAHWTLFKQLGGVSHAGHEFEPAFFQGVLDVLAQRFEAVLLAEDGEDAWFQGTLGCVLRFDEGLVSLPLGQDEGLAQRLLSGEDGAARTQRWVAFEKQQVNAVLTQSVWSARCFTLSIPAHIAKYDTTKAGRGAVDLVVTLDALIAKLTKANLTTAQAEVFGTAIFCPCVERFADAATEVLAARLPDLHTLLIAANSLVYLRSAVAAWANTPLFCGATYLDDSADMLSGVQSRLMQGMLAGAARAVVKFDAAIEEAQGGVTAWTPVIDDMHVQLATIAATAAENYSAQLRQFVFDEVEQHVTERILHRTAMSCKTAVLQHAVTLANEFAIPTPLLDEALLLLSLDADTQAALRAGLRQPDTTAAAEILRSHAITHLGFAHCTAVLADAPPPPRERKRDKVKALVTGAGKGVGFSTQGLTQSVLGMAAAAQAATRMGSQEEVAAAQGDGPAAAENTPPAAPAAAADDGSDDDMR